MTAKEEDLQASVRTPRLIEWLLTERSLSSVMVVGIRDWVRGMVSDAKTVEAVKATGCEEVSVEVKMEMEVEKKAMEEAES